MADGDFQSQLLIGRPGSRQECHWGPLAPAGVACRLSMQAACAPVADAEAYGGGTAAELQASLEAEQLRLSACLNELMGHCVCCVAQYTSVVAWKLPAG